MVVRLVVLLMRMWLVVVVVYVAGRALYSLASSGLCSAVLVAAQHEMPPSLPL